MRIGRVSALGQEVYLESKQEATKRKNGLSIWLCKRNMRKKKRGVKIVLF